MHYFKQINNLGTKLLIQKHKIVSIKCLTVEMIIYKNLNKGNIFEHVSIYIIYSAF